jgi:hypothetical protein
VAPLPPDPDRHQNSVIAPAVRRPAIWFPNGSRACQRIMVPTPGGLGRAFIRPPEAQSASTPRCTWRLRSHGSESADRGLVFFVAGSSHLPALTERHRSAARMVADRKPTRQLSESPRVSLQLSWATSLLFNLSESCESFDFRLCGGGSIPVTLKSVGQR